MHLHKLSALELALNEPKCIDDTPVIEHNSRYLLPLWHCLLIARSEILCIVAWLVMVLDKCCASETLSQYSDQNVVR